MYRNPKISNKKGVAMQTITINIQDNFLEDFLKKYEIKYFYHFTDISNLKSIQENGLLSLSETKNRDIDVTIFSGNNWSHQADDRFGVDKYVHLAFDINHPMLYIAQKENRINNHIWLKINTDIIFKDGVKFTNQVANKLNTKLYNLFEIEDFLDSEVLFTRTDWTNPQIQKRLQQARKSELLIPNQIPISYISW